MKQVTICINYFWEMYVILFSNKQKQKENYKFISSSRGKKSYLESLGPTRSLKVVL